MSVFAETDTCTKTASQQVRSTYVYLQLDRVVFAL